MAVSVQYNAAGTAFAAILSALKARVVARIAEEDDPALSLPVRVCAVPNDKMTPYLAQPGVILRARAPMPFSDSGAGRWAHQVLRDVDAFVVTMSLADKAGEDEIAVLAHSTREELVLDALVLHPPVGTAYNLAAGTILKWVPGGEEMVRQVKTDQALVVSCLSFRVQYTLKVKVLRE